MELIQAPISACSQLLELFRTTKRHLVINGIKQWDFFYPNRFVIMHDLKKGELYGVADENGYVAAVTLNERQAKEYRRIPWKYAKPLVIHRLAVAPHAQGHGIGKKLLMACEEFARANGYESIRLDAYSGNEKALGLYEKHGYERRGEIMFPLRALPYVCFEKKL
ncbi:MAG: GNAT family N-acetyltransferase [Clostridia bacterium]